jgi:RNA polymerase sigma-70 factor, ECF subfamily
MSFLSEVSLADDYGAFAAYRETFGFVPNLLRAQALLPRLIDAQVALETIALTKGNALRRLLKEEILLILAAARRDIYCVTARSMVLRTLGLADAQSVQLSTDFHSGGHSGPDLDLIDFCLKLNRSPLSVESRDIEGLRASGFHDAAVLEAGLVTALSSFLCTLSAGLGAQPDSDARELRSRMSKPTATAPSQGTDIPHLSHMTRKAGPYIRNVYHNPTTFAPFARLQKTIGFVPNFFRAQALWPELVETEADSVIERIIFCEGVLTRVQKECIFVAVSAVLLNSYCVAAHCNLLRSLGMSPEESDQVAVDYHQADLSEPDKAMLDFAVKLGERASEVCQEDIDRLRAVNFSDAEILECVALTAAAAFINTLQAALGVVPDFELPPGYEQKKVRPSGAALTQMQGEGVVPPTETLQDADAGLVAQAQGGGLEAFEELVRRHSQLIYRTLMAILGNPTDAQDAMQDALLNAFKHLAGFQGRSKFTTWLVSIAKNAALERLRNRERVVSLDEDTAEPGEDFRPRQVRAWQDDPEQMCSSSEMRQLVERGILQLPTNYRVVVILRDIEDLSTEEVARQLGLSVPALKSRLFRGRLMLREFLSPYFAAGAKRAGS